MAFTNKNMDLSEFTKDPVQEFVDSPIRVQLNSQTEKVIELSIQAAKSKMYDNLFKYWEYVYQYFFRVSSVTYYSK